jgi:phosphatidylglycerophosphate synthase
MAAPDPCSNRRPLASRNTRWAIGLAAALARWEVSPNAISVASLVVALAGGACLVLAPHLDCPGCAVLLLLAAGVLIQLRLLCNLLDGMVAVEGGRKTAVGGLYNEIPDRIADVAILVGAGYAAARIPWASALGWGCAALALMTAYLRALGQTLGAPALYLGPMAKQQRMAVMTLACIAAAIAVRGQRVPEVLAGALAVIACGTLITCWRRIHAIAAVLQRA